MRRNNFTLKEQQRLNLIHLVDQADAHLEDYGVPLTEGLREKLVSGFIALANPNDKRTIGYILSLANGDCDTVSLRALKGTFKIH